MKMSLPHPDWTETEFLIATSDLVTRVWKVPDELLPIINDPWHWSILTRSDSFVDPKKVFSPLGDLHTKGIAFSAENAKKDAFATLQLLINDPPNWSTVSIFRKEMLIYAYVGQRLDGKIFWETVVPRIKPMTSISTVQCGQVRSLHDGAIAADRSVKKIKQQLLERAASERTVDPWV